MNPSLHQQMAGQGKLGQAQVSIVASSAPMANTQSLLLSRPFNQSTLCINSISSAITPVTTANIGSITSIGSSELPRTVSLLDGSYVPQQSHLNPNNVTNIINSTDNVLQYHAPSHSVNMLQNSSSTSVFHDPTQSLKSSIGIIPATQHQTIVLSDVTGANIEQMHYALVTGDNNEGAYLVPASSLLTSGFNVQPTEMSKIAETTTSKEHSVREDGILESFPMSVKLAGHRIISHYEETSSGQKSARPLTMENTKNIQSYSSVEQISPSINEVSYIVEASENTFQLTGQDSHPNNVISEGKLVDSSLLEVISLDEAGNICEIERQVGSEDNVGTKIVRDRMHEIIQKPIGKGPYFCEICRKKFHLWSALKKHSKDHENDKRYSCRECDATFNLEKNLTLHSASHNTNNLICPECGTKFRRMASFKSHLAIHQEEDNLACPECEMEFTNETRLEEHISNEHQPKTDIIVNKFGSSKRLNLKDSKSVKIAPKIKIKYGDNSKSDPTSYHNTNTNVSLPIEESPETHLATNNLKINSENRLSTSPIKVYTQKCVQCDLRFKSLKEYNDHKKQHTVLNTLLKPKQKRHRKGGFRRAAYRNKCKYCDKTFPKPSQCERHERIHTGIKPFKCKECSSCFNQKNSLEIHMRKHTGDKPYNCKICNMGFTQNGNLRAHIVRTHFVASDKESKVLKCEECPCVFKKVGTLNAHVSKFHSNMKRDVQLADDAHECHETNSSVDIENNKSTNDLLSQALVSTGLEEIGILPVDSHFDNEGSRTDHSERGVMVLADKDKNGKITKHLVKVLRGADGVKRTLCNFCDRGFKKPSDLCRHLRLHTLIKPFKCRFCTRAFSNKITLNSHSRIHGTRILDSRTKLSEAGASNIFVLSCYKCPNKKFGSRASWRAHLKLHGKCHSETKSLLKYHQKDNIKDSISERCTSEDKEACHDPQPLRNTNVACDSMKDAVPHENSNLAEPFVITSHGIIQTLPRHRSVYQPTSRELLERPYKCENCPARFKKSAHLKQHKLRHTGEKPFLCKTCHKPFVSRSTLNAHIKTHVQDQVFQCGECSMTFTTPSSVRRHMARHREERPFLCPYCQKTFKTNVLCRKHMKVHKSDVNLGLTVDINNLPTPNVDLTKTGMIDSVNVKGIPVINSNLSISLSGNQTADVATEETAKTNESSFQNMTSLLPLSRKRSDNFNTTKSDFSAGRCAMSTNIENKSLLRNSGDTIFQMPKSGSSIAKSNVTPNTSTMVSSISLPNFIATHAINQNPINLLPQMSNNGIIIVQHNTPTESTPIHAISLLQQQPNPENNATDRFKVSKVSHQNTFPPLSFSEGKINSLSNQVQLASVKKGSSVQEGGSRKIQSVGETRENLVHLSQLKFTSGNGNLLNKNAKQNNSNAVIRHSVTFADNVFHCTKEGCEFTSNSADGLCNHVESTHAPPSDDDPVDIKGLQSSIQLNALTGDIMSTNHTDTKRKTKDIISMRLTKEQEQVLTKLLPEKAKTVSEKLLLASIAEKERRSVMKTLEEEVNERSQFPHKCNLCGKGFKKPSDLIRHIRTHTGEKPFACETCEKKFSVKSTLEVHKRIHTGKFPSFKCHVCNLSTFTSKSALKTHLRLHTGAKPYVCPFKECNERFRTSGHRKVHIANVHTGSTPGASALDTVVDQGTIASSTDPQQTTSLVPLSIPASSLSQALQAVSSNGQSLLGASVRLQLHGSGLDNTFAQFQVDEGLLQQISRGESINIAINPMDLQQQNHQRIVVESKATKEFPNAKHKVNANILASDKPHSESQMNRANKSIDQIRTGLANNNGILKNYMDNKIETRNLHDQDFKILTLPVVKTGAVIDGELSEIGTGDISNRQVAEITSFEEVSTGVLDIASLKDIGQVFLCSTCNQVFPDKERDAHFFEVHGIGPKEPNNLLECHEVVIGGTNEIQEDIETNVIKLDKTCTVCGKAFSKPSQMERHMRIHTGEKPFSCGICLKAFNQKNALKKHNLKHSGERPYVCPFCAYAFNQKGNLKTHIQRTHSEQAQQLIEKDLVPTH